MIQNEMRHVYFNRRLCVTPGEIKKVHNGPPMLPIDTERLTLLAWSWVFFLSSESNTNDGISPNLIEQHIVCILHRTYGEKYTKLWKGVAAVLQRRIHDQNMTMGGGMGKGG